MSHKKIITENREQERFFKELYEYAQLDEHEQAKTALSLLPLAMSAICELQKSRTAAIQKSLEVSSRFGDYLRSTEEITYERSDLAELSIETIEKLCNDYEELHSLIGDDRKVYDHNIAFLKAKVIKAKQASHSDIARQVGGRKNQLVREKAHCFLRKLLAEEPSTSINSLAAILESVSLDDKNKFGKVIPFSTCKDYARTIKKEVESSIQ